MRVGWFESPFNRIDQFGRRTGYAYEYQQIIAAYTGWTYEYVEGSWPDLLQMLMNGEIDLLSDVSYTEERTEYMLFPKLPMGTEEYYLFVEPGISGYTSGNYEYFNGKRVGVNKGSVQEGFFDNWLKTYNVQAEIVELTCTAGEAFEMLRQGELDGYIALDAYGTTGTAVPEIKIGFGFLLRGQKGSARPAAGTGRSAEQDPG
ncbi:MAG: transporter substrate-binding domain-containing protein [Clostridia bacterium]|nr:transporter substrate-binding domain-containing protein [Clostridia bacterium]